ncbi:MAG TPA: glycosyltransferase family A protein [Phycisphaerae bacterium]|nr:glycosyltransferase family A protein [Phycisphaerae bacterium]
MPRIDADSISVIIPTYNSASIVEEAIDSVLRQTRPPGQVIVVDDGSTDGTETVCQRFGDRIEYIRQANGGASVARNTGVAQSRGEWLAFLDADDLWEPEKLDVQIAALSQHPEADFSVTAVLAWSPQRQAYEQISWQGSLDPRAMQGELLVRNILTGLCSSLLVHRDVFEEVGGFPAGKGSEDRRIALELLKRHRGVLVDLPVVRQRPGPAHWTDPERQRAEMIRLINDYADLYSRLGPRGRLRRRAWARVHERTGMHYLENGDLRAATRDLLRAATMWPFMANPWRVLLNACLGRLRSRPRQIDA